MGKTYRKNSLNQHERKRRDKLREVEKRQPRWLRRPKPDGKLVQLDTVYVNRVGKVYIVVEPHTDGAFKGSVPYDNPYIRTSYTIGHEIDEWSYKVNTRNYDRKEGVWLKPAFKYEVKARIGRVKTTSEADIPDGVYNLSELSQLIGLKGVYVRYLKRWNKRFIPDEPLSHLPVEKGLNRFAYIRDEKRYEKIRNKSHKKWYNKMVLSRNNRSLVKQRLKRVVNDPSLAEVVDVKVPREYEWYY